MIVAVGDVMLDIYLLSELRDEEQSGGLLIRTGGSAANTAVWAAHAGQAAAFVGSVGADPVGDLLAQDLAASKVHAVLQRDLSRESGAVAVEVSSEGERSMRSSRGANQGLSPDHVRSVNLPDVRMLHLTAYGLLSPYGLEVLDAVAELARGAGASLSFDPSSVSAIHRFGAENLCLAAQRAGVDVLLPNAIESKALADASSPEEAARKLLEHVPTVVVKDGVNGALCASGKRLERVPTVPVRPVDTTGAGDAFNAGVLVGLARGDPLDQACRLGNELAGRVIRHFGGRPLPGD